MCDLQDTSIATKWGEPMAKPRMLDNPAFRFLRMGDLAAYHEAIENCNEVDLSDSDLRGTDFRKADLSKLVLRRAYLRDADFRGCDLRHLDLEGASLQGARISGAYFPTSISAGEIRMSLKHGTRLRTATP